MNAKIRRLGKNNLNKLLLRILLIFLSLNLIGCTIITYSDYHGQNKKDHYLEETDSYRLMIEFPQTVDLGFKTDRNFDLHHANIEIRNRLNKPVNLIVNKFGIEGDGLVQAPNADAGYLQGRNDQFRWSGDETYSMRLYSAKQLPEPTTIRFEAVIEGEKISETIKASLIEKEDPTYGKPTKKYRFEGADNYTFQTKNAEIKINFFAIGKPQMMKLSDGTGQLEPRRVIQMDAFLQNKKFQKIRYEIIHFELEGIGIQSIKAGEIGKSVQLQPNEHGYYRNYAFVYDSAYTVERGSKNAVCVIDFVFDGKHVVHKLPLQRKVHRGLALLD